MKTTNTLLKIHHVKNKRSTTIKVETLDEYMTRNNYFKRIKTFLNRNPFTANVISLE